MREFLAYLNEISNVSQALLNEKFDDVLSELDTMIKNLPQEDEKGKKQLSNLKKKFSCFLKELPVIGFNSSRYDINVIKQYLFRDLENSEEIESDKKSNMGFL